MRPPPHMQEPGNEAIICGMEARLLCYSDTSDGMEKINVSMHGKPRYTNESESMCTKPGPFSHS